MVGSAVGLVGVIEGSTVGGEEGFRLGVTDGDTTGVVVGTGGKVNIVEAVGNDTTYPPPPLA
jgi:hypothetical protein